VNNLELWDKVSTIPNEFLSEITGKTYKGTSIKPHYVIMRLTEEIGLVGDKWGYNILKEHRETFPDDSMLHTIHLEFWHKKDDNICKFTQFGATKYCYKSKDDRWVIDEDYAKKTLTDALLKCASYLGFGADVYLDQVDAVQKKHEKELEEKLLAFTSFNDLKAFVQSLSKDDKECNRSIIDKKAKELKSISH
jgi:hypothetical protein